VRRLVGYEFYDEDNKVSHEYWMCNALAYVLIFSSFEWNKSFASIILKLRLIKCKHHYRTHILYFLILSINVMSTIENIEEIVNFVYSIFW